MQTEKNGHQQSLEIPKSIIHLGQFIQFFSINWATSFAQNLFITPLKFKTPKRELEMLENSNQTKVHLPNLNKDIIAYHYGSSSKKALLIHGWNGRGTQLVTIANMLLEQGYATISFDAPGHGKSPKSKTNMTEFIATCFALEKKYGPFDLVIGHSLGGMTTMNALNQGLKANKAVLLGSGDVVEDIIDDFVKQLELKQVVADTMKKRFEAQFKQTMASYCVHEAAKNVNIPVLVIHDEDDKDVPVKAAKNIYENLKQGQLMITKKLGHRKILGDKKVIANIRAFLSE